MKWVMTSCLPLVLVTTLFLCGVCATVPLFIMSNVQVLFDSSLAYEKDYCKDHALLPTLISFRFYYLFLTLMVCLRCSFTNNREMPPIFLAVVG